MPVACANEPQLLTGLLDLLAQPPKIGRCRVQFQGLSDFNARAQNVAGVKVRLGQQIISFGVVRVLREGLGKTWRRGSIAANQLQQIELGLISANPLPPIEMSPPAR